MLFLQYGVNVDGELVAIDVVGRGKTELSCPYCGRLLIARKGTKVAHHFAHAGETCNPAARDMATLSLPVYDKFNLDLPGKAIEQLRAWNAPPPRTGDYRETYLEQLELLKFNDWKGRSGDYELTRKGKLVLGQLSLDLFNQFQEPLILQRHADIEARAAAAGTDADRRMYLTDLRLYRAQLRRILACSLYFIQVGSTGLYKIGVTTRDVQERVQEIAGDLRPAFGDVSINVLGVWPARGNVEYYFKHRHDMNQKRIGSLTEYFHFAEVAPVLRDLKRMKPKLLSAVERGILAGDRPEVELVWESEEIEKRRIAAIRPGIERARSKGTQIGRPPGKQPVEKLLEKPYVRDVRAALAEGRSLRDTARVAGVAVNTVRKIQHALRQNAACENTVLDEH